MLSHGEVVMGDSNACLRSLRTGGDGECLEPYPDARAATVEAFNLFSLTFTGIDGFGRPTGVSPQDIESACRMLRMPADERTLSRQRKILDANMRRIKREAR